MPKRKKKLKYENPEYSESARHYDCRWYSRCLYYAAKRDAMTMKCAGCIRYEHAGKESAYGFGR